MLKINKNITRTMQETNCTDSYPKSILVWFSDMPTYLLYFSTDCYKMSFTGHCSEDLWCTKTIEVVPRKIACSNKFRILLFKFSTIQYLSLVILIFQFSTVKIYIWSTVNPCSQQELLICFHWVRDHWTFCWEIHFKLVRLDQIFDFLKDERNGCLFFGLIHSD